MTEQTFIDLGRPDVSELRVGDIVTMTYPDVRAVPFEAEVWEDESGELAAGTDALRFPNGEPCFAWERYVDSVKRPVPPLPMKPGAVVFPHDPKMYEAFVLDETGETWRSAHDGTREDPADVARRLAVGRHYVAFEGVGND